MQRKSKSAYEFLTKELLEEHYINLGKSSKEISEILNISRSTIERKIVLFGIKKSKEQSEKEKKERTRVTSQEIYGTDRPCQSEVIREKIMKTNMDRYGVPYTTICPEVVEKMNSSMIERYGVKYPAESKEILEKMFKTNIEKYGSRSPFGNSDVYKKGYEKNMELHGGLGYGSTKTGEKITATMLEKYGVEHIMQSDIMCKKSINTKLTNGAIEPFNGMTKVDAAKKYEVGYSYFKHILKNNPNITEDELKNIKNDLEDSKTNIEVIMEGLIGFKKYNKRFDKELYPELTYRPDFKLNDKLAINTDGLYWHSDENVDKSYHFNMRKDFEDSGLRIMQFYSNEITNKSNIVKSIIFNSLGKSERYFARKLKIKEISGKEAECFLNDNHIMGYKSSKSVVLVDNNEKIKMIMTYRVVKNILKIERMCSEVGTTVVGGFSKLLSYIEKITTFDSIEYWVDLRYGTGNFLLNHNFIHKKDTQGWRWTDRKNTFNRLKCTANMDERNLTEKEHASELGWSRIYDAGQRLYVKTRTKNRV
jgi:transposase